MLIMNQSKNAIYNMDAMASIEVCENDVFYTARLGDLGITLGTYEFEDRAKEVLMELFNNYGKVYFDGIEIQQQFASTFIMPDK